MTQIPQWDRTTLYEARLGRYSWYVVVISYELLHSGYVYYPAREDVVMSAETQRNGSGPSTLFSCNPGKPSIVLLSLASCSHYPWIGISLPVALCCGVPPKPLVCE